MGWERRGTNSYYYKKERAGSKVKSVYVGCGDVAHMISKLQSSSRMVERLARLMKSPQAVEQEKVEAELDQLTDQIHLITHGALLAAGFHTHKRQWRKKRHGRADRG